MAKPCEITRPGHVNVPEQYIKGCAGEPSLTLWRPAMGTAAGGATVAAARHRDGTRPATGHITHRIQSKHAT
ncbi:hypothetical protein ACLOJK_014528 [Asimina triloba]